MNERPFSVVIPNYNGRPLLERYLKKNLSVLASNGVDHEVIVVDDGSEDDSVAYLREVEGIRLVARSRNGGFSRTCNEGAGKARQDLLFFLNTDVDLVENPLPPLSLCLENPNVFAVAPKVIVPSRGTDTGHITGSFRRGFIRERHRSLSVKGSEKPSPVLYACGAALACRRAMFVALGGFDELFSPYFFEDFDIGYRAWKRGWEVLYEPAASVIHQEQQTIGQNNEKRNRIYSRNRLIFHWKNLIDSPLRKRHFAYVGFKLVLSFIKMDLSWLRAFAAAWALRPEIKSKRLLEEPAYVLTDRELLARWEEPG